MKLGLQNLLLLHKSTITTMNYKTGLFSLLFIFSFFLCKAQDKPIKLDSLYMVVGRVSDKSTDSPLPFAGIFNKSTGEGTITDTLGIFRMKAHPTDTLKITCLGFIPMKLELSSYNFGHLPMIQAHLNRRVFVLKSVDIKGISWRQFKNQVMNQKAKEEPAKIYTVSKEMAYNLKTLAQFGKGPVGGGSIPLSFPDKKAIQREKVERLEGESLKNDEIKQKYSKKMVERLTGLKDDELITFEDFCNFSNEFLYRTNEYNLIMAVLSRYDEYRQLKKRNGLPVKTDFHK